MHFKNNLQSKNEIYEKKELKKYFTYVDFKIATLKISFIETHYYFSNHYYSFSESHQVP